MGIIAQYNITLVLVQCSTCYSDQLSCLWTHPLQARAQDAVLRSAAPAEHADDAPDASQESRPGAAVDIHESEARTHAVLGESLPLLLR